MRRYCKIFKPMKNWIVKFLIIGAACLGQGIGILLSKEIPAFFGWAFLICSVLSFFNSVFELKKIPS